MSRLSFPLAIFSPDGSECPVAAVRLLPKGSTEGAIGGICSHPIPEILGEFGDGRAVPSLLQALVDRRGTVRPCPAAQSLVRVLDAEDASQRRAWAAWRLGDEGLVGSLDALADALEDPSDRVAMAAAAALLRFGSVSEEILLARASNPGAGRRLAVAALGLVGTERSLGFLASIGDPDEIGRGATRSFQWLRLRGFSNRNALASRRLGSSRP